MHASDICYIHSLNESHLTQDTASTPCPFCNACVHDDSPDAPLLKPLSMLRIPKIKPQQNPMCAIRSTQYVSRSRRRCSLILNELRLTPSVRSRKACTALKPERKSMLNCLPILKSQWNIKVRALGLTQLKRPHYHWNSV